MHFPVDIDLVYMLKCTNMFVSAMNVHMCSSFWFVSGKLVAFGMLLTILHQTSAFFAQSGVQSIKHNMNIELPIHYTVCSYCMHLNMTAAGPPPLPLATLTTPAAVTA